MSASPGTGLGGGPGVILAFVAGALLASTPAAADGDLFVDRAAELGLDFTHFNGMSGEFYFSETVGPGGALFDYDNDGDLDVYLVQGHMLGTGKTAADAVTPPRGPLRDRLFRNDLGADGRPRFVEVTEESRIRAEGYGMGVSTGDVDNDGWVDLYVTNFGQNQLWMNQGRDAAGRVTFVERTREAGVGDLRWSVPATFLDLDRDGWLDLFVGNYVEYSIASHKLCRTLAGAPDYCGPLSYKPEPDRLFRNTGAEAFGFEDLSARSGITSEFGGALGAVAADFDGDGWPDLYVGNDGTPNQMWMNRRDGRFVNEALLAGTGVNMLGRPEASMGVTVADFDSDGDEDIFLTHLSRETNTLYLNDGSGLFEDATHDTGLDGPSLPYTGFGTAWLDFDNDGWLDLLAVNGEVRVIPELEAEGDPHPLHQPNLLFRNLGAAPGSRGRFADVTASAGAVFALSEVSRGVAVGDVDNDGDADVLLLNNNGPVRLLVNENRSGHSWVGLRLVAGSPGRDQLGARVVVRTGNGRTLWRRVDTAGSYLSASDPRLLLGLGPSATIESLEVHWIDGVVETFEAHPGTYTTLIAGTGRRSE